MNDLIFVDNFSCNRPTLLCSLSSCALYHDSLTHRLTLVTTIRYKELTCDGELEQSGDHALETIVIAPGGELVQHPREDGQMLRPPPCPHLHHASELSHCDWSMLIILSCDWSIVPVLT